MSQPPEKVSHRILLLCFVLGLAVGAVAGLLWKAYDAEMATVLSVGVAPSFFAFTAFGILALVQRPANRTGAVGLAVPNLGICLGMVATYFIW